MRFERVGNSLLQGTILLFAGKHQGQPPQPQAGNRCTCQVNIQTGTHPVLYNTNTNAHQTPYLEPAPSHTHTHKGEQTVDHIIYNCNLQEQERERLKAVITRSEQWPVSKNKLVLKYYKNFKQFTDNIVLNKE
jgi:hypothetical protein